MKVYMWYCNRCKHEFGLGSYAPSEQCPNCGDKQELLTDEYTAILTRYEQKREEKRDKYYRWEG